MSFIEMLAEKAKKQPKKIVFPEAEETRVLQAARRVYDMGIAFPVLLGIPGEIKKLGEKEDISLDGMEIADMENDDFKQEIISEFLALSDMFSEKALNRKFKTSLNLAAAMVRTGKADCLAAGVNYSTGEVILAAQMYIGMEEGVETPSSIGICEVPGYEGSQGNMFAITDCAVNAAPNAAELADIAIASAGTVSNLLDWQPRVAMLSFSTKGSGAHEDVDKVREAVEIAKKKRPELLVDGEFQLDTAIIPEIAARKTDGSSAVAGKANILVFPSLEAGNIGVKLLQIFGKALAHGPLLQGFAKPVTDFSRSAPVEEMVGNLTMLVARAGGSETGKE